ncbi:hypothetical protein N656DRAFT_642096 [Canariomyces notabilis]|uniref:Uncharacterized protein n=1 Tax=Canariomyces notabilis TaxID=2074819 RepID=A0AAN6YST6_9PEZI|nr:hypothetical protein N656DRAFT_642096 [Canariomyces arenarius]
MEAEAPAVGSPCLRGSSLYHRGSPIRTGPCGNHPESGCGFHQGTPQVGCTCEKNQASTTRKSLRSRSREKIVSRNRGKTLESIYNNWPMETLILVKRLRLRQVLIRLPCLHFALPLHKQFPAAIIPPVLAANLLHLPLLGGFELGLIPHLNSPGTAPRELLGDRGPRKSFAPSLTTQSRRWSRNLAGCSSMLRQHVALLAREGFLPASGLLIWCPRSACLPKRERHWTRCI